MNTAERLTVARHINNAFEAGRNTSEAIAYCGISLEGAKKILETGILQARFTLFPRILIAPIGPLTEEEAFKLASGHATQLAGVHYLLEALGMEITSTDNNTQNIALSLTRQDGNMDNLKLEKFARSNGNHPHVILEFAREANLRKGIVLTIGKNLQELPPNFREATSPFLTMDLPTELDHKYICGLEPLGNDEYAFFAELQQHVDRGQLPPDPAKIKRLR